MKTHLYILILLNFSFISYSQTSLPKKENVIKNQPKEINNQVNIPDKINIVLPKEFFEKPKQDPIKDYFPAIITLIVGLLMTWANWAISKKLRESNKEIINRQLDESKNLKLIEIRASIHSKNRQEWMNEYRELISEFTSLIAVHIVQVKTSEQQSIADLKKLLSLNTKLKLLLHPDRPDEKEAIENFGELFSLLLLQQDQRDINYFKKLSTVNSTLVELSRNILERNWQKMNNQFKND